MKILFPVLVLVGLPVTAFADAALPLPEPETLALVAIGAVGIIAAHWLKR